MLSITRTNLTSSTLLARSFSTTLLRSFEDSAKKSAIALEPSTIKHLNKKSGNSFGSFAEYRKSAIQHGPLRGKDYILHTGSTSAAKPILTDEKDYGVSESFAKSARSQAYRD